MVWTAVPEATRSGGGQMLIARPASVPLDAATRNLIEAHVKSRTGREVTAAAGTLPRRLEITFTNAYANEPRPVDDAALSCGPEVRG